MKKPVLLALCFAICSSAAVYAVIGNNSANLREPTTVKKLDRFKHQLVKPQLRKNSVPKISQRQKKALLAIMFLSLSKQPVSKGLLNPSKAERRVGL